MTATVSDETGREALQSPQHIIEGIILRRLHDERIEGYTLEMSKEIAAALSAAPVGEPVQDTWFTDRALPVVAMSGDIESERVLKLHFRRKVTEQDRIDLTDALNLKIKSATNPSASPVAQEPVAWQWRYVGERDDQWKTPSGGRKITDEELKRERPIEQRPLYADNPPATPAGVGADEIARAIREHIHIKSFMASHTLAGVEEATSDILALLSRAGDQSNSTHEA